MKKRTSAYVDTKVAEEIKQFAEENNKKVNRVIIDLIKLTIKSMKLCNISDYLTEYQNHKPNSWQRLNYYIENSDIDLIFKIRQHCKISISKLLFIGFLLFWNKLLKIYKKDKTISNELNSYAIIQFLYIEFINIYTKRFTFIQLE